MSAALLPVFFIVVGLAACFRAKEWGRTLARRIIAYDAVWFYQLLCFVTGGVFATAGIVMLVQWVSSVL